jgi:hypothetical protein
MYMRVRNYKNYIENVVLINETRGPFPDSAGNRESGSRGGTPGISWSASSLRLCRLLLASRPGGAFDLVNPVFSRGRGARRKRDPSMQPHAKIRSYTPCGDMPLLCAQIEPSESNSAVLDGRHASSCLVHGGSCPSQGSTMTATLWCGTTERADSTDGGRLRVGVLITAKKTGGRFYSRCCRCSLLPLSF